MGWWADFRQVPHPTPPMHGEELQPGYAPGGRGNGINLLQRSYGAPLYNSLSQQPAYLRIAGRTGCVSADFVAAPIYRGRVPGRTQTLKGWQDPHCRKAQYQPE